MNPAFFGAFIAAFDEVFADQAREQPASRVPLDPGIGREFSVSFQVIIPTAPEGFSNARISATQVCSYAPGEGATITGREAVVARELESIRNSLLAEGERLRMALSTGSYSVTRPLGSTQKGGTR